MAHVEASLELGEETLPFDFVLRMDGDTLCVMLVAIVEESQGDTLTFSTGGRSGNVMPELRLILGGLVNSMLGSGESKVTTLLPFEPHVFITSRGKLSRLSLPGLSKKGFFLLMPVPSAWKPIVSGILDIS